MSCLIPLWPRSSKSIVRITWWVPCDGTCLHCTVSHILTTQVLLALPRAATLQCSEQKGVTELGDSNANAD